MSRCTLVCVVAALIEEGRLVTAALLSFDRSTKQFWPLLELGKLQEWQI